MKIGKIIGKKGMSSILITLFFILIGIAAIWLLWGFFTDIFGNSELTVQEMLKLKDWDNDNIKDIVDKCPCGSLQDEPQDLLGDNKKYCVSNFKPKDVCLSKYKFNKWSDLKGLCYYDKDDCLALIGEEYKKEAESQAAKDN